MGIVKSTYARRNSEEETNRKTTGIGGHKLRAARRNPQLYEQYFTAKRLYKTEIRKSKKAKLDQEIEKLRNVTYINYAWQYLKSSRGHFF